MIFTIQVENFGMVEKGDNFVGQLADLVFLDDASVRILAMNEPVSFFNVDIGRG